MTTTKSLHQRNTAICDIHPIMRPALLRLIAATGANDFTISGKKCVFAFFEGYRSPERQMHLFTVAKTTKARPWQSAHQYGLAVDFAVLCVKDGLWSWDANAPWGTLKALARLEHLDIPISWDRGHVQHPAFEQVRSKRLAGFVDDQNYVA